MHLRGWVRPTPRYPAGPQIENLIRFGVKEKNIYVDGRGAENWESFIRTHRPGEATCVDGLHRLAGTRRGFQSALHQIALAKGKVLDVANGGEPISAHNLNAVTNAFQIIAGEDRIPTTAEAQRRGKLGGRPGFLHLKTRANKVIWRNAASNKEAEKKVGVRWRTMNRWWGPSGRADIKRKK